VTGDGLGTPCDHLKGLRALTEDIVTAKAVTEPPADPAAVTAALESALRDLLWESAPYGEPCGPMHEFSLLYEEDYSAEDRATPRETAVLCTPDGRYWHATIAVTVVEQTVRTPVEYDEDDEDDAEPVTTESAVGGA
jgi:hypothetical protein